MIAKLIDRRDLLLFYFPFFFTASVRPASLRIRSLPGKKVFIRRGVLIDRDVVKYVFVDRYHLPVQKLPADATILDLGSNIGLTMVHLKQLYPGSRIIGYEMDAANYRLARQNCAGLDNCEVYREAVWSSAGEVWYDQKGYEDGYAIEENAKGEGDMQKANAVTLQDIFRQHQLEQVDYLKMDIEGAEKEIFLSGSLDWLGKLGELNIECHDEEFLNRILPIIRSYGLNTWRDHTHFCMIRAVRGR